MSVSSQMPQLDQILAGLKDFQRDTVEYVFNRLYDSVDPVKHFLIADEVGLGKTLVARGVVAKAIDRLRAENQQRIDIIYICANQDIARQNISRLNLTGQRDLAIATRMTLLPLHMPNLQKHQPNQNHLLNFVSFTPGTSFDLRSQSGVATERVLLYYLLKKAWQFGEIAGPKNLLQVGVGRESWHQQLNEFDFGQVDPQTAHDFVNDLRRDKPLKARFEDLIERFGRYRIHKNITDQNRADRNAFIGELRQLLAKSCVRTLKPNIVILDEFQRFKNLVDIDTETDDMALLAQALFDYRQAKVLLLSATPYKMYTPYHETAGEDHYADFLRTVKFLLASESKTRNFENDLRAYREALLQFNQPQLRQAKEKIERQLRQVMVRTERLSATLNLDGMLSTTQPNFGQLTAPDLQAFITLDRIAETLDVHDLVEYWKSAPYLLNLMDRTGYKVKERFIEALDHSSTNQALRQILKDESDSLLSWSTIQAYQRVDPGNSKFRTLLAETVERGAWKLLWVPPSLPYYEAEQGPYAEQHLKAFTKSLIFSAWQVVPKVIATLGSYEAERRMVTNFKVDHPYDEERLKRRPLLRFAFDKTESSGRGRPTGLPNFTLLYPCLTLATEIDPLLIGCKLTDGGKLGSQAEVLQAVEIQVDRLLTPILEQYVNPTQRVDERWYWASLALLDKHYHRQAVHRWLTNDTEALAWPLMVKTRQEEGDTNFAEHVAEFQRRFQGRSKLGSPPKDLVEVLAKVALASPAVTSLRALFRQSPATVQPNQAIHLLAAAAKVSLAFRSLFNIPDVMALIRGLYREEETRYWKSVLDYCGEGNLQAVLDEYTHMLRESLGLIDQSLELTIQEITTAIETAVSLRTASLSIDEIHGKTRLKLTPHTLRCRFALRFGDDKDEEKQGYRKEQVRTAFNSPFHPFILATTSIGQEGLDFHQYCHQIFHWNLPSNPADLEQREGRIHRYKGHVIRRNIGQVFPLSALNGTVSALTDPWQLLFRLAKSSRADDENDLVPYWVFEPKGENQGYKIQRFIPALPLSRDNERLESLRHSLVAYRMVFGQPRQEDLVNFLQTRLGHDLDPNELLEYRIDLSPPPQQELPQKNLP